MSLNSMLLALSLVAASSTPGQDPGTLPLLEGESVKLQINGVTRIAVGDPSIADVKLEGPSELMIVGVSAGKTTLLVWRGERQRQSYLLWVKPKNQLRGTEARRVELRVGEKRVLEVGTVTRSILDTPNVIALRLTSNNAVLEGKTAGHARLTLVHPDGSSSAIEVIVTAAETRADEPVAASTPSLSLKLGEEQTMDLGPVSKIAIGDPKVVDVQLGQGFTVTLVGKAEGHTQFHVWNNENGRTDYEIDVRR